MTARILPVGRGTSSGLAWPALVASLVLPLLIQPAPARAAPSEPPSDVVTIAEAVSRGLRNDPRVAAASHDARRSKMAVDLARVRGYRPTFSLGAYGGLIPGKTEDREEFDRIGPYHRIDLDFVWPVLTFGRAPSMLRAARSAAEAEEERARMLEGAVARDVIMAYEGLVAAREGQELAEDLRGRYRQLLDEMYEQLEDETSGVDDTDLFEAQTHRLAIERNAMAVSEQELVLARALAAWLGRSGEANPTIDVVRTGMPAWRGGPDTMEALIDHALRGRADVQAMRAATTASAHKLEATSRASRPTLFLGGQAGYARAPTRTEAFDAGQFNYTRVAAGLGLRWDLTFSRHRIDGAMASAEHQALLSRRRALELAVEAGVVEAFAAVETSASLLEVARDSQRAAQRWLRLSSDNWSMGLGDLRRVIRAHESFYSLRAEVMKAELDYRMNLVRLAHVLGDVRMYERWCSDERIEL